MEICKVKEYTYQIESDGKKFPAYFFISDELIKHLENDAIKQLYNCSQLPGVYKYVCAMPDVHTGYGCPIGGVLPFTEEGVLTVGGCGFDINCGVRLVKTGLKINELNNEEIKEIIDDLFKIVPAGLDSKGKIKLSRDELYEILLNGAKGVIEMGFGKEKDLDYIEDGGYAPYADLEAISDKAISREKKQIGTLGSGNHYLEIQVVSEIFDEKISKVFGLEKGDIVYTVHCGSRGFGHQIGSDYLNILYEASKKYEIPILDKELVCAPIKSKEGEMYFGAVNCAINYAFANRQVIDSLVRNYFEDKFGFNSQLIYDIGHNTIKKEKFENKDIWVHRKGSTRAYGPGWSGLCDKYRWVGQPIIIGGSMGTSSYLLVGTKKAEDISFASTCHGAGRIMSRKKAKEKYLNIKRYLYNKGIYVVGHSVKGLAEEAPSAYKDVDHVINVVHNLGISKKVLKVRPLGVIKG